MSENSKDLIHTNAEAWNHAQCKYLISMVFSVNHNQIFFRNTVVGYLSWMWSWRIRQVWRSCQKFCVWFYYNNKIQDKNTTDIPERLHMSPSHSNHQHCQHTFPICVVNDQLQLCICPCSGNVKRQWQQCWYCLPIQIVYAEDVLSHAQEHAWLFGHCWACVESTLHILFVSLSSWWGYCKHLLERFKLLRQLPCMKYCVYKNRFHLFHVTFICCLCCGSTTRASSFSSQWPLNCIHPLANVFIWRNKCS
jgi:hypothetical protein